MNETETRLADELKQEADTVQVDLDRMWSVVQEQTRTSPAVHRTARPWRRRLAPYVAAASVAAVVVTVAVVDNHDRGPSTATQTSPTPTPAKKKPTKAPSGPVDQPVDDWACAYRTVIQPRRSLQTYELVPAFVDPREVPDEAKDYAVPRYHFTLNGKTGVLDYGDAAGRRISRTKLTKSGDRWRVGDRTLCSGADGRPSPDPVALGKYTAKPRPFNTKADTVKQAPPTGTPVLVDDRTYFDGTGLLRQTTLYAYPAKGGYAFARVPDSNSVWVIPDNRLGGDSAQVNSSSSGPTNPFGEHAFSLDLIVSYLTGDRDVTGLRITSDSGQPQGPAQKLAFGGKTLYTVVARSKIDGDTLVTVLRKSGNEAPRRY